MTVIRGIRSRLSGGNAGARRMTQDIAKGRRTETDFINGYVALKGEEVSVSAPTHVRMNELVKRVERREIQASPENITGW